MKLYCDILSKGELLAIPTETVYGLGADATNSNAVSKIYTLKKRPDFNPLIVHCHNIQQIEAFCEFNPKAYKLASSFWPGSLTLILPLKESHPISLNVTAGLKTIGVRIPNHPLTLSLLKRYNKPIAAPSANMSGKISPTTAAHVKRSFGENAPHILDGGACDIGLESTIIGFNAQDNPILLRAGGIPIEAIEYVIGPVQKSYLNSHSGEGVTSPGQLLSHYAPDAQLVLNSNQPSIHDGFLAFGPNIPPQAKYIYQLSQKGDLFEAASNLYSGLHYLDQQPIQRIHVAPMMTSSIGAAITDRLMRAASETCNES